MILVYITNPTKGVAQKIAKFLLKKEVEKIHPYQTPCVLKIKAEANEKYLNWLKSKIK